MTAQLSRAELRAQVQAIIEDVLGCQLRWDDPTSGFRRRPEWGSFEQVRIMNRLDDAFGIATGTQDVMALATPDSILDAVHSVLAPDDFSTPSAASAPKRTEGSVHFDPGLANTVLDTTEITDVDPAGSQLRYRGHDVAALSSAHCFDEVASLLVDGELCMPNPDRRACLAEGAALARSAAGPALISYHDLVARFAGLDLAGLSQEPDQLRRQGWRCLGALAQLVGGPVHRSSRGPRAVAQLVAGAVGDGTDDAVAGLDALMILQADHGCSAAALAVRTAISAGADLHAALLAGLVTFGGHRHGGALADVVLFVEAADDRERLKDAVRTSVDQGTAVPGFGHRVYHVVDPRVEPIRRLLVAAEERRRTTWWSSRLGDIRAEMSGLERTGAVVNVDFYAGPLLRTYGFPGAQLTAMFAVARVAGWIAHAVEQTERRTLIRPGLKYIGDGRRSES